MARWRGVILVLAGLGLLLLASLTTSAGPAMEEAAGDPHVRMAGIVASQITYQGRLTNSAGDPVSGSATICFSLWTAQSAGTQLSSECRSVTVENGLFTLALNVNQGLFNGQELWLRITVDGQELSPRQQVLPVPYALSLRPGAVISATTSSAIIHAENTAPNGRGLRGYATATSGTNFGVVGASTSPDGYGGYFYNTVTGGVGLWARGGGDAGPDLVLGGSDAGDDGRIYSDPQYSGSDILLFSYDEVWVELDEDGNSAGNFVIRNGANNTVFKVDEAGNLTASGAKTGYVVDIARNVDNEALEPGDVVVIAGAGEPVIGTLPVIEVRRASAAYQTGVAGVVDQAYAPETAPGSHDNDVDASAGGFVALAQGMAVRPGGYLSVVTLGAFRFVKADASYGPIEPGDLLATSPTPGHAMKASDLRLGTVLGKALAPLQRGTGLVPLLVTLD